MAKRGRKPNSTSNQPQPSNLGQAMNMAMQMQQEPTEQIEQQLLFVYGSLMTGGRFHNAVSHLERVGTQAYLPFTKKTMLKQGGYPTPIPDPLSMTIGEAYSLPTDLVKYKKVMQHLDDIESVDVGLYARTILPIIIRTSTSDMKIGLDFVLAWVYIGQHAMLDPLQVYDFSSLFAQPQIDEDE